MKAYKIIIIIIIIYRVSRCTVLMKTYVRSIVIGAVFKNWVNVRIKYLCNYRISEKKMTLIIPLAFTVYITHQP
jgi:hypothetical protein